MWLLYGLALVLGGGTLLVQLLMGGHHDAHGGHGLGIDHHSAGGPGILSTRSLTFALFAFGMVGAPLHSLGLTSPGVAFSIALVGALATAYLVSAVFRTIGDPAASGAAALHEAEGKPARVLLECGRATRGKIRVSLRGQTVDMIATTDAEHIPAGSEVRVQAVRDDLAHVVPTSRS